MRKRWYRRFLIMGLLFGIFVGGGFSLQNTREMYLKEEVSAKTVSSDLLIPGGMPIGIYMETDGVMVLGTEVLEGIDGLNYEPAKHLVKSGDYIIGINGECIENKRELLEAVKKLTSDEVVLKLRRAEEVIDVKIKPVKTNEREYRLGIWVRDNAQGLGTITFLNGKSEFGALGHGIHDVDTNELLDITDGTLYETSIKDIQKGESGTPGGMEGIIIYNNYNVLGSISKNTESGIYGTVDRIDTLFADQTPMVTGKKEEIMTGDATIRCAVEGSVKDYKIKITKVDLFCKEVNKGIVLEVTDPKLLKVTGGIVQGMSGSPIIQNGKIVGAVTHVFVQDATKGYGIFIENMLKNIE